MRGVLVAAQLSVSLTLLSGGGLLYETLRGNRSLVTIPDPGRVLLMSVQPSHQGYSVERSRELFRQLQERVARLPGVRSASVARDLSIDDGSFFEDGVAAEPRDPTSGAVRVKAGYDVISPDYFGTLGVPLVGGREISVDDRSGAPPVVIVNATLARRLWPGQDPLGRTLRIEGEKSGRTVVGVARDRPTRDGPRPFFYYPLSQHYPWPGSSHLLHVRTAGDPMGLVAAIRREAAALDARLPLYKPRLLTREIAGRQFFERFAGAVIGGSGLLALLLSAIGLYGVTSHWVSVRTQEIGVRVALGARPDGIVRLVMGQALKLVAAGVGIGLVAALALNRALSSVLFGARPAGPLALVMASLVLIGVAMLTSWLPARRASRVDPVVALRSE
jgi:putative ABC transport system permease protein